MMRYQKFGQFPDEHDGIGQVLANYGLDTFEFSRAPSGIENSTFVIRSSQEKYILRIYRHNKKTTVEIDEELKFMQMLRDNGLPIPKIIPNNANQEITLTNFEDIRWQAILMEFMEGKHPDKYSLELIKDLAIKQANIHLLGAAFTQSHPAKKRLGQLGETEFIHLIPAKSLQNSKLKALIERAKEYNLGLDRSLPAGYSHFDYDADNILVDPHDSIVGILDFDDLLYAPFVMCLSYTLWAILFTSKKPELVEEYVRIYETKRPLSPEEKNIIAPIMLFRHYVLASLVTLRGEMDENTLSKYLKWEKLLKQGSL